MFHLKRDSFFFESLKLVSSTVSFVSHLSLLHMLAARRNFIILIKLGEKKWKLLGLVALMHLQATLNDDDTDPHVITLLT